MIDLLPKKGIRQMSEQEWVANVKQTMKKLIVQAPTNQNYWTTILICRLIKAIWETLEAIDIAEERS